MPAEDAQTKPGVTLVVGLAQSTRELVFPGTAYFERASDGTLVVQCESTRLAVFAAGAWAYASRTSS